MDQFSCKEVLKTKVRSEVNNSYIIDLISNNSKPFSFSQQFNRTDINCRATNNPFKPSRTNEQQYCSD
jgi:hypothetical protein